MSNDFYTAQAPFQPVPNPNPEKNGFGLAAVILGPIGLLLALIPLTGWLAIICGFTGLIFGIAGLARVSKNKATNKKTAITGIAACLLAIIGGIAAMVMFFSAVDEFGDSMDCLDAADTLSEMDAC